MDEVLQIQLKMSIGRRYMQLITLLFFAIAASGQTRTISGRIIDDKMRPFFGASILIGDSVLNIKSDDAGRFNIIIPAATSIIRVLGVNMQEKKLVLHDTCSQLEIILQQGSTYDFTSFRKVKRMRKRSFKKLPALHRSAFSLGLFTNDRPCYNDIFISTSNICAAR